MIAGTAVRLERVFAAPREAVFEAWTAPEVLQRWWAAKPDWDTPFAEVDLRPGGHYHLAMRNPQTGETRAVAGEYLEVTPPERLVYTWAWEGGEGGASRVTVDFSEADGRTTVVVLHEGLPADDLRAQHEQGWTGCLDNLERRVSEADRVGVDVTVEQRIARPRDEVAAFAMDPANDRRWIGALTEVNQLTPGPVAPGTRVQRVAKFLGRRMEYVNEIAEYDPPRRLFMRSVKAPFPLTVLYEFDEDGPAGTLARIRTQGEGGRYYRVAGPLLSAMVRRGVARDLRTLKRILESAA